MIFLSTGNRMDSRFFLSALVLLFAIACKQNVANGQRTELDRRQRRYNGARIKRMFALCPPKFERIGNECYFLSKEKVNWMDAQFQCKDRNSKLAEPTKVDDRRLRKHLLASELDEKTTDLWLGGKYDWKHQKWQWAYNGRRMNYQAFGKFRNKRKDAEDPEGEHHLCTVMKRNIKYRWSPEPCMDEHFFICQHRMPVVKKSNLQDIYNMWNNTFPNQIANEIEVIFTNKDNVDLRQRFQVEPSSSDKGRLQMNGRWDRPENLRRVNEPQPRNRSADSLNSIGNKEVRNRSRQFRKKEKARIMEERKEMHAERKKKQWREKCFN